MNRQRYIYLRHSIRAGGWSWNWGSPFKTGNLLAGTERFKTPELALVASTLRRSSYDDFQHYSRSEIKNLADLWRYAKNKLGPDESIYRARPLIWWKNIMRSNVRHDNYIFTEQLTNW